MKQSNIVFICVSRVKKWMRYKGSVIDLPAWIFSLNDGRSVNHTSESSSSTVFQEKCSGCEDPVVGDNDGSEEVPWGGGF